jgi:hypothetical protein
LDGQWRSPDRPLGLETHAAVMEIATSARARVSGAVSEAERATPPAIHAAGMP